MDFKASHLYAKTTARKARYVVDLIRDMPVNQALETLKFVHRRAARLVEKVLRSALANAEQDVDVDLNTLHISKAVVDEGPLLGYRARIRAVSRGRAVSIKKRLSHIKITLSTPESETVNETTN
ncbi:MAG: 50S ribosomal protein L22 [Planctomycetes bacterium]|nr:50S ribosomal protein L22 [Planctomycetota bacterium]